MYALLSRIPDGLDRLRSVFEDHVKRQGLAAVEKVAEAALSAADGNGDATGGGGGDEGGGGGDDEDMGVPSASKPGKKGNTSNNRPSNPSDASSQSVDPKIYVEALLNVHKKYHSLVFSAFRGEAGFVASLDKACREFMNRNRICKTGSSKSPEYLARFCDSLLRKSSKMSDDREIEEVLNSIVSLAFVFVVFVFFIFVLL